MSDKLNEKMDQKRRDFLKGLATVPVFGFFLVNLWAKLRRDALKRKNLLTDLINEFPHKFYLSLVINLSSPIIWLVGK